MTPQRHTQVDGLKNSATAAALNGDCYCRTLDGEALRRSLLDSAGSSKIMFALLAQRPTLFSATAVFLSPSTHEQLVAGGRQPRKGDPQPRISGGGAPASPPVAAHAFGPLGVFVAYDFHLVPDGPRLIEINSNAGGALLNVALAGC